MSARAGLGITVHRLEQVLDGDLDEFIDALVTHDQAEQLKESPSPRPAVDP
jgi:peptide chain release factor 1